jgi:hypothetical protein
MRPVLVALLSAALLTLPAAAPAQAAKRPGEQVFKGALKRTKTFERVDGKVVLRIRMFVVTRSGRRYRLVVHGVQPPIKSRAGVRVVGVLRGRTIHARADGIREQGIGDPLTLGGGLDGSIVLAIVYVDLADDATHSKGQDAVRKILFEGPDSVAAYYRAIGGGRAKLRGHVSADGDFFGPYKINYKVADGCHQNAWMEAASAKAKEAGVDLAPYDHVIYMMPPVPACPWSGLANQPGKPMWINGGSNAFDSVFAHELGHNLGLNHVGFLRCTENGLRTSIAGTCTRDVNNGGDPWALMGQGKMRFLPGFQGAFTGFIAAEQIASPLKGGTFSIVPMESTGAGTRLLRLVRRGGRALDLEFHRPAERWAPYTATDRVVQGVTIRESRLSLAHGAGDTATALVDATPETPGYEDATFLPGQTLTDTTGGVTVTVDSVTPEAAKVTVSYAFTPDVAAPSDPAKVVAKGGTGPPITVTWEPSTDNVGVAGYRVHRYVHATGARTLVGTTKGTTFRDDDVKTGWYIYAIEAFDEYGNVSKRIESPWLYLH